MTVDGTKTAGPPQDTDASPPRRGNRRPRSLARRLVRVAALWSVLGLAVAGFILVGLYKRSGERAFDSQLDQYVKIIVASMIDPEMVDLGAADAQGDTSRLLRPRGLGEPRFALPLSGWYWSVSAGPGTSTGPEKGTGTGEDKGEGTVLFASGSLVGDLLTLPGLRATEDQHSGFAAGPAGEEVRYLRRSITLEGQAVTISVAIISDSFRAELVNFGQSVALTLVILGAGLVAAVFWQVRFGLKPLTRLQASLADVREGSREAVDEDMPQELAPLAVELNALIHSNREVVERARTHAGNLAHALKTPISVLTNEARAAEGPLAQKVREQTVLMQTQVQHHLERARLAAQRRVIGVSCEVEPLLARLARAMGKIHQREGITVSFHAPADLKFRGEAQDLEELAGNLLDNACKWAKTRVSMQVTRLPGGAAGRSRFEIVIEDDGPGLSETERREAVKRGKRLDETVPGTGLGLSIAVDLAALYGGELQLLDAELGGLQARLVLPLSDSKKGG